MIVDDACERGSPIEWFRPYPDKVNAVRSVWLWLCDRCGRIWTRHFDEDGVYFQVWHEYRPQGKYTNPIQYI